MKLTCFLICVTALTANANAYSQSARVTVSLDGAALEQVFNELSRQAQVVFLYDHQLVDSKGRVELRAEDMSLSEVLDKLLPSVGLTYVQDDNVIIIREAAPQEPIRLVRLVTGVVTDENNRPLPGVNVVVKGTTQGVATDQQGQFRLNIEDRPNTAIMVSFIGKEPQEIKLTKADKYTVKLTAAAQRLDDIVVTGYQTLSRERSAGSFSRVSGEDISSKANLTGNILETLEGLAPGLSVNFGTGQDKFLIRGTTSINSSREPLIVIDGVAIDVMTDPSWDPTMDNTLNPDREADIIKDLGNFVNSTDIESVTFLKDATAASIWGARAANGVIVITTKRGTATGSRPKITYDGSYTYKGLPDYSYYGLMNSRDFITAAVQTFDPEAYKWSSITSLAGGNLVYPHEFPLYQNHNGEITDAQMEQQLAQLASQNNRRQIEKYLMQPEMFTKHNISFRGGSQVYSYYGSVGYEYNQNVKRVNTNKFLVNFRQNIQLAKWLTIDLTTNLSLQNNKAGISPADTDEKTLFPYQMLADADGNPVDQSDLVFYEAYRKEMEEKSLVNLNYVPLDDMHAGFNKTKAVTGRVNLGIAAQLAKGLRYEGRFQYQQNYSKRELFYGQESFRVRKELVRFTQAPNPPTSTTPTYFLPSTGGRYELTNVEGTSWTARNQFSYDRELKPGVSHITAMAGMEIQASVSGVNTNTRRGYDPQSQTYQSYDEKTLSSTGVSRPVYASFGSPRNTLKLPIFKQTETERRFVSFYANAAYTYLNRYSINGSIRVDQSNLYGSDPSVQFKPVWSLGAAWNLGREEFMSGAEAVDRLNVRFSYGLGGNSPSPGQGGPYNLLKANTNTLFSGMGLGYAIIYPANEKICWERTRTINLGVDFALFRNRLSGSVDVYHKLTTDLLGTLVTDQTLGWESVFANMGDMKNQGFELMLTSRNIVRPDFQWSTVLTLTNNKNKVLKLNADGKMTASRLIYLDYVEGYAGNSLFAYRWAGLNNEGNPQVYNAEGQITANYQDPALTPDAIRFMGVTQPKWYGGLTNTFSYKNFDLSFMLVYNFGHKMRRDVNNFWYGRLSRNVSAKFADRWQKEGDERVTDVPKWVPLVAQNQTTSRNISFYQYSDLNVVSASYVKLRDVTLTYNLPRVVCEKLSAERIAVRAQASNLFMIAANKDGIDPEYHQYREGLRGTRYGPSWSVGLTVNFK